MLILDRNKKNAEDQFRNAFERIKLGTTEILPKGTRVSQNNVAKEAGRDPSALRKTRYPLLIIEIQDHININKNETLTSERQKLIKRKQKNRDLKQIISDLKKQRDKAVNRIIYSNLRILELSETVDDLMAKLEAYLPTATILTTTKLNID